MAYIALRGASKHKEHLRNLSAAVALLLGMLAPSPARAQTFSRLHSFACGPTDGRYPTDVIVDAKGNLYGSTWLGGVHYSGTVFEVPTHGREKVLYSFTGKADGGFGGQVIRDSRGNLYGTTSGGGILKCNPNGSPPGCGTVFKLDIVGKETVLYRFSDTPAGDPPSGLIRDAAGDFYGTTEVGGATSLGGGTVYKMEATGKLTVLYSFTGGLGGPDGAVPTGNLVRDSDGNLYGATYQGGPGNFGTVFKVDATGKETVLYTFMHGADGFDPIGPLIRDASGNLYGTAIGGGAYNKGTVFKLDANGTLTVLHSFGVPKNDGISPEGLIADEAGNFYGTTADGGEYGWGTVFKLDTTGTETVLHSFTGKADGKYAVGTLARDKAGNLYGVTQQGGFQDCGVVFKIKP